MDIERGLVWSRTEKMVGGCRNSWIFWFW